MNNTINQPATVAASYYIRAKYFYYAGTFNAPQDGALCDEAGNRLEFDSPATAEAHLLEQRDECNYHYAMGCEKNSDGSYSFFGTYICRHGEYSRPRYTIRKVPARA